MEQTIERLQAELRQRNELLAIYDKGFANLHRSYTCTICDNLMFEPCVIACGHSFCYTCLLEWFKRHKTCPSCRLVVTTRPTISFQIKETVDSLVEKLELVVPTEDKAAVRKRQKEQRDLVASHKRRHGEVFPDMFGAIIEDTYEDDEDGVRRCARCHWELESESGRCLRCFSWQFSDDESLDDLGSISDEEDGSDMHSEDDDGIIPSFADFVDMWNSEDEEAIPVHVRRSMHIPRVSIVDSDDNDDSARISRRTSSHNVVNLDEDDLENEAEDEDEEEDEDEDDRQFIDDRDIGELSEVSEDELSTVDSYDSINGDFAEDPAGQAPYYDSEVDLRRNTGDDDDGNSDSSDDDDDEADGGIGLGWETSRSVTRGSNSHLISDASSDNENGCNDSSEGENNEVGTSAWSGGREACIEATAADGGEEADGPDTRVRKRARYSRLNSHFRANMQTNSQREMRRIGLQRLQNRRQHYN
ncbi:hypothetical protein V1525DRAFT_413259 [Lipomyces kononenkoae]|uniref:Uncharacterized protein n=1 Tax=Lipomyces kononenkoae TaxID=34357 RepID=A0ACC3SS10_LIPKO